MHGTKSKKALLIGCQYPGCGEKKLTGCWNDVRSMRDMLIKHFHFEAHNIRELIDDPQRIRQPTGPVVEEHLRELARDVKAGDVLVFYFSGHGFQLPPEGVPDETHGQECIVLPDDYVITDMDFRVFVESLPSDVWFTIIADSCHSGGLVQHLEEQIGGGSQFQQRPYWSNSGNDHVGTSSEPLGVLEKHRQYRQGCRLVSKGLTVDRFIRILSKRTQRRVEVGSIRANLYDIFKDEASFMVKSFAKDIFLKLQKNKMWNTNGNLAAQFFQQRLNDEGNSYAIPAFAEVQYPLDTAALCNKCVLISACQSYEEAADVEDGSSYGVLTNAIKTILDQQTGPIENFRLVVRVKRLLEKQGHSQHPGLYCGEKKASSVFICY